MEYYASFYEGTTSTFFALNVHSSVMMKARLISTPRTLFSCGKLVWALFNNFEGARILLEATPMLNLIPGSHAGMMALACTYVLFVLYNYV